MIILCAKNLYLIHDSHSPFHRKICTLPQVQCPIHLHARVLDKVHGQIYLYFHGLKHVQHEHLRC
jgi:hypothetical protein